MNLDLLIKLVKLANNNPNENEANLAARKVCKIIEEGKYQFNNKQPEQPKQPQYQAASNPTGNPFEDFLRYYGRYGSPFDRHGQDFAQEQAKRDEQFRRENVEFKQKQADAQAKEAYKTYYYDEGPQPFTQQDFKNVQDRQNKPKTKRTCSECGRDVLTTDTSAIYFICNACRWIKYAEGK